MPIDYEALVAPFRTAYFLQRRSISESLRDIAIWLTKRLRATEDRERDTRTVPVFGFRGDALAVWIDVSQHGALGAQGEPPPAGIWAGVAAPFVSFWNGLLLAPTMIRAEGVLPDLVDTLAGAVQFTLGSLNQFQKPDKSLFDLETKKRWYDLIGELGLFFRIVNDPATVAQVKTFTQGGMALKGVLRRQFGLGGDAKAGGGGQLGLGGDAETGESTDFGGIASTILGAALAIPITGQLVAKIAETASFVIRLKILEWSAGIYREALGVRRKAIDLVFVTLFGAGSRALEWLVMLRADVVATLDLYTRFVGQYLEEIRTWILETSIALKTFGDGLIAFIRSFAAFLEALMDIQFAPGMTLGTVAGISPELPAEAAPPDISDIQAPNIATEFLGVPEAAEFSAALAKAGPAFTTNLDKLFNGTIKGITGVGETMGKAGSDATKLGSAARYEKVVDQAGELAEAAFGGDASRASESRAGIRSPDAFESWLAGSAFVLIRKALRRYAAEMVRVLEARSRAGSGGSADLTAYPGATGTGRPRPLETAPGDPRRRRTRPRQDAGG